MNATSLLISTDVVKTVVETADAIVERACSCVPMCNQEIIWDTSHRTFLAVIRNLSLNVVDGQAVDFVFTIPEPAANCWITSIDPFLLAEAMREIQVNVKYASIGVLA